MTLPADFSRANLNVGNSFPASTGSGPLFAKLGSSPAALLVPTRVAVAAAAVSPRALLSRAMTGIAVLTALAALTLATVALVEPTHRELGRWIVVDPAAVSYTHLRAH